MDALAVWSIIASVVALLGVYGLKRMVQSDINGIRDAVSRFDSFRMESNAHEFISRIGMAEKDISALWKETRNRAEHSSCKSPDLEKRIEASLQLIALRDEIYSGYRVVCHRGRYYVEGVCVPNRVWTELPGEWKSFDEANALILKLLERESHKHPIHHAPLVFGSE